MNMVKEYIVKKGDTLWDISSKYLGSPMEWPRLWKFNNRKEVVAITNKPIVNPDLIYPGQKILIPSLEHSKVEARQNARVFSTPKNSLDKRPNKITAPMSLSYKLDDIRQPPIIIPNAIVEIKMTGNITLSSVDKFPINYVINDRKLEATVTSQANKAFGALISDTKLAFDEKTKKLTLGTNIISKSTNPNLPTTSVGVEVSSNSPLLKLKYEVHLPQLKGKINQFNYLAEKVSFILEVTFTGSNGKSARENSDNSSAWDKPLAIGLFAGATLIVIGTLVEDYVTFGAGVADDPASFAAAAGMTARGVVLWGSARAVVIPATLPAVVRFTTSIVPAATFRHAH
ncbi:LysM peptidoglycan-binding domain-containing protein [Pseudoalteromonas sp. Scap03]|nr:LysM peptidoglycan-binding domain-containing protein [Pseudoalteromonas sp. Scap03]QLE82328.1 LysM peptidoglycan-binding domain-containing protein [Pseudoalteromonas sp. Scap25]QLE90270.1 LysM peptidoglycan-binding domain-containing protein [Pseudoalteromonas sp. Scap06]